MNEERNKNRKIYTQIDKLSSKGKNYVLDYYRLIDEIIAKGDFGYFGSTLEEYFEIDINKYQTVADIKKNTWDKIIIQANTPFSKKLKKLFNNKGVYQVGYDVYSNTSDTLSVGLSQPLSSSYSMVISTQSILTQVLNDNVDISVNDNDVYLIEVFKCDWGVFDNVEQPIQHTIELINRLNIDSAYSWKPTDISIYGYQYLLRTHSRRINDSFNYKLTISENKYLGQIKEDEIYIIESRYYIKNKQLAKLFNTVKTNLEVYKPGTYSISITASNPSLNNEQNLLIKYEIAIDYLLIGYIDEYAEDYFLEDYAI